VWRDLLIVNCDGHDVQYTVALDKLTGQVRWRADHPGRDAYSTPLVIEAEGGPQLIASCGGDLLSYKLDDGSELWRFRHAGQSVVPRPVFGNGLLYFSTGYWTPTVYAVRVDGHGDLTSEHVPFSVRRGAPHNPSPLVVGERLYLVSDQGVLSCTHATKGYEIWRERLTGSFSASPVEVGGKIYLVNEDATTFVVADGKKYRPLAENHLDGQALASPAVLDGALLLRTATHLYRIEESRNVRAEAVISRRDTGTALR
jgi:hypothetical protein